MHLHDTVGGDTVNQLSFTRFFFLQFSQVLIYNKDSSELTLRTGSWQEIFQLSGSHKPRENFS